jgi:transcriptional regulator
VSDAKTHLLQGTLDILILRAVSLEPMHGFGIARRIVQVSQGVFRVNPGSLLVAFQRLERTGMVAAEWRVTENNRRGKFYRLTAKGRRALARETEDWSRRLSALVRLIET